MCQAISPLAVINSPGKVSSLFNIVAIKDVCYKGKRVEDWRESEANGSVKASPDWRGQGGMQP